jgi:hypothetical protein
MHLHHHPLLTRIPVSDFRHTVSGSADFEEYFTLDVRRGGGYHQLGILRIAGGAPSEVRLMLFALGVSEVGAFVGVKSEAETALEGA